MTVRARAVRRGRLTLCGLLLAVAVAGCDLFAPRAPEDPIGEAGTFQQPDTPDLVVSNLRAAVAELNTDNYRRSLAEDFVFVPTADAEARHPALTGWTRAEEISYFTTLAEAARLHSGHELRLADQVVNPGETEYVLEASYILTVHHGRPGVPETVQGRLVWEIAQDEDGLWRLARWTDQTLGSGSSWSDLKAEFVQ